MKHRTQLRGVHGTGLGVMSRTVIMGLETGDALPPPDPSTRVDTDLVPGELTPSQRRGRRSAELTIAAGLGGILVSVSSVFLKLLSLPSLSEVSVAGLGGALILLGILKGSLARHVETNRPDPVVADQPDQSVAADLPSLTGQLSGVLAQLRQQYGMAYRTQTWIEEVLPAYGDAPKYPGLARDLLAAAALDAGGIRADVAGLADSHSRVDIVITSASLLETLQRVLAACEGSTEYPAPPSSDLSCWPASTV
ncbi:MAG: hypothetical protein ABI862_16755 [Ilumatobacteraceae bacterium]